MLMAMDLKREYTAVLDNAYNVGYEKIENQIGNLEFSMPLDDPKNEFLQEMLWVELTDNENEYIGLYRVMLSTVRKDASNNSITYTANEALCTLLDTVLFGYHELVNRKTVDVINYLLNKQRTKHWVLKNVNSLGILVMHGKMKMVSLMPCLVFLKHLMKTICGNGIPKFIHSNYL